MIITINNLIMKKKYSLFIFLLAQNLLFSQILLTENFPSGAPTNTWERKDLDGDGFSWEFSDNVAPFPDGFAVSVSKAPNSNLKTDDVLISPTVFPFVGLISVSFKIGNNGANNKKSHCAVYIISADATFTGSENPIYNEIIGNDFSQNFSFEHFVVSPFKSPFKVVFRHYSEEVNATYQLKLDDIIIEDYSLSGTSESSVENIKVYPNPTVGLVKVKSRNKIDKILLYDMTGKFISETSGAEVDFTKFEKGTYLMNIYTNNKVISEKIIKK